MLRMLRIVFSWTTLCAVLFAVTQAVGQAQAPPPEDIFYESGLHYTNRGIEFIYSKEHGGLEKLTGMSAEKLGCLQAKCHVRSCDACHRENVDGKAFYSVETARTEAACQRCHPMDENNPDVHFKGGMKCMDCHSAREIHGDGVAYDTYMQPGFFDTRCENCHNDIPKTASHTVHGGKLDCSVCHALDVVTCFNCHIDTRIAEKKDVQIERHGLFFLVNHEGEVTLGNLVSYVYGNKTMITVAPSFPHSITEVGRTCEACHATSIVRQVKEGALDLLSWRDGNAVSPEGVVPVIEGMKWNLTFLGRTGDQWNPLEKPDDPLISFSGYCTPLSGDQLNKLERAQPEE